MSGAQHTPGSLTESQRAMLGTAAVNHLGVVTRPHLPGFEGVTWDRNARRLCERGYLKPYVHGGYEVTATGRAAIEQETVRCGRCQADVPHNCAAKACPVGTRIAKATGSGE